MENLTAEKGVSEALDGVEDSAVQEDEELVDIRTVSVSKDLAVRMTEDDYSLSVLE